MKTALMVVIGWYLFLEIIIQWAKYTSRKSILLEKEKERQFKEWLKKKTNESRMKEYQERYEIWRNEL